LDREISKLSPKEQPEWFRALAGKARTEAKQNKGTLRLTFLQIAEQWEMLATATEVVAKDWPSP